MKKISVMLILIFLVQPAFAADGKPTAESVRKLMDLTQSRKMLEKAMEQVDAITQETARQTLAGQPITLEQERILNNFQNKMIAVYQEEMSWQYMEPIFIEIYQKSFNQKEIDGLVSFYQSDLGQAVIHKMPVVLQNTMQAMQSRSMQIMPRIQALQQEMVIQLQNTRARSQRYQKF